MSSLNSSQVLEKLFILRRTYAAQNFTFTADQAAQWAALRQARWARVAELRAAAG